jgi:hypothetical protein
MKNLMRKISRPFLCCALIVLLFWRQRAVFGKDLAALVRILYPAFLVEQGSAMCMVPSITLSDKDKDVFIDAKNYTDRIKEEVTARLMNDEVRAVLVQSANLARTEISKVVRVLKLMPLEEEYAELLRWCTTRMKPLASKIVGTYYNDPHRIDQEIENANRD